MSRVLRIIRPDQPCPYWGKMDDTIIGPCEAGNDGHEPPCRITLPASMTLGPYSIGMVRYDLEEMWDQQA